LKIFKSKEIYLREKILVRRIGSSIISVYDDSGKFNVCDVYNIQLPLNVINDFSLKTINGILNSKLIDFYFNAIFKSVKKLFPKIAIQDIKSLPLPHFNKDIDNRINQKVDDILMIKKKNPLSDTLDLESQIDQLIYQLYELTEEEIKIIEGV
jgi:DNA polymerase/3'-5' exonuclease PolX